MEKLVFETFIEHIDTLSPAQWATLNARMAPAGERQQVCAFLESVRAPALDCPRCHGTHFHKHGVAHGLLRYRCTACRRTFNVLSGTPLARLRKRELWPVHSACMLDSRTVRQSAARAGVHRNTSFRWRHRMLHGVRHDRQEPLAGTVEADEMYILESQKGSRKLTRPPRRRGGHARRRGISREHDCILVARERTGRTLDFVTGRAPLRCAHLERCLTGRIASNSTLVSDSHTAYALFARRAKLTHRTVNLRAGERVRGDVHVQNVNAYHGRFRGWLARFRGVASKYLPNYLGWHWAVDGARIGSPWDFIKAIFRRNDWPGPHLTVT